MQEFNFYAGYIPSIVDDRDYGLEDVGVYSVTAASAPVSAKYTSPVTDQGPFGMCVAFAAGGIVDAIEMMQRKINEYFVSRGFIYAMRLASDFQGEGMMPREALKMLSKVGVVKNSQYNVVGTYPTCKAGLEALGGTLDGDGIPNKIKGYVRLKSLEDIKTFITKFEIPVFCGLVISTAFYMVPSTGIVPPKTTTVLGGHAMQIIGTEIINGVEYLKLQNSWGTSWGKGGYGYVKFEDYAGGEYWGLIPEASDVVTNKPKQLMFIMNKPKMYVDNVAKDIPQGPILYNSKTMVPVRELCEAAGGKVSFYQIPNDNAWIVVQFGGQIDKLSDI